MTKESIDRSESETVSLAGARDRPATATTQVVDPSAIFENEQFFRTRAFFGLFAVLAIAAAATFPLFPPSGIPTWISVLGCLLGAAVYILFAFRISQPSHFTRGKQRFLAAVSLLAPAPAIYSYGVFSTAIIVYSVMLYFFGLSQDGLWFFLGCVALYVVPIGLIVAGAFPDPGMVSLVSGHEPWTEALWAGLLVIMFLITYRLALSSRSATRLAVERWRAALLGVDRREAQLREANAELDHVLRAGKRGRYSDEQFGDFRLGEVIGRGGMGEVYRARRVGSDEPAAVKLMSESALLDDDAVRRFVREADLLPQLISPHVVRVLATGLASISNDRKIPYIAMELLTGNDLAWHLRQRTRLPANEIIQLVRETAAGLSVAAKLGVVHRDLKPQNLFLDTRGGKHCWKILDFGVSKVSDSGGTLTQGAAIGTPNYMAPEQVRAAEVGPAADVFSLATIAYRALTGRPAFGGSQIPEILFEVCFRQPPLPVSCSMDVQRVLAYGLAKNPTQRLQTAQEFSELLTDALEQKPITANARAKADALLHDQPWGRTVVT